MIGSQSTRCVVPTAVTAHQLRAIHRAPIHLLPRMRYGTPMQAVRTESTDLETAAARFRDVAPAVDFCSLRLVEERDEHLAVRRGVVQPPHVTYDSGAMVTVAHGGGVGYAATSDLTAAGLRRAAAQALAWAQRTAGRHLLGEI